MKQWLLYFFDGPALVAQLHARLTGDQEVVGSTPAGSATFFFGDWSWNIFFTVILSLLPMG